MDDEVLLPETPYKGLSFYTEADAPFFFGRERETKVVAANLLASRLTLLYGESGVGKSSLLRAGVARYFQLLASENIERRGTPRFIVIPFPSAPISWSDDPIDSIRVSIERAVEPLGLQVDPPSRTLPFCDLLAAWVDRLGSDLLIVLDQFEEYLLYHEGEDGSGTLATELPRALARPGLRASFLLSIREDALARLDRFKGRIPTLFDNYLRVNHLDREGARDAIIKPIHRYNELADDQPPLTIEPQLVETLLDELETGRVTLGPVGLGVSDAQAHAGVARRVETPYLQLVMTRLWTEEVRSRSTELRLATLRRLGGSRRIVETHLDETMRRLPPYSRYVAARIFRHLVTPSGMKIAHTAADLAVYGGLAEDEIDPVLERLTAGDTRVLRRVGSTDRDQPARYEIFHDVLAAPILDWPARGGPTVPPYVRAAVGFHLLVGVLLGFVFFKWGVTAFNWADMVYFVWSLGALAIWVSTTVVFVAGWRRRNTWLVAPVGALAAALAPAIVATGVATGATRVGSRLRRRRLRVRPGPAQGADDHVADAGVCRFLGLAAIAGAAVSVVACVVPVAGFDVVLVGPGESLAYLSDATSFLAVDPWFALPPLFVAGAAVVTGGVLLARAARRPFASALLAALGVGAMLYFAGHNFWNWALEPVARPSRGEAVELARAGGPGGLVQYEESFLREARVELGNARPEDGVYLGAAAAALFLLIGGAPVSVLLILAAIVGAGRTTMPAAARSGSAHAIRSDVGGRRKPAASVLAIAGAALIVAACFAPSGGWFRDASASLADMAAGAALQALGPAIAAAAVAGWILARPRDPHVGAGFLAGTGLALLALFAAVLGSAVAQYGSGAPAGGYAGIAGSGLILVAAVVLLRNSRITAAELARAPTT